MFKRANIIKFVKDNKKQIMFALFALYCIFDKNEVYKSVAPVVVVEGVKAAKAVKAAKTAKDIETATKIASTAKNIDNTKNAVNTAKKLDDAKNTVQNLKSGNDKRDLLKNNNLDKLNRFNKSDSVVTKNINPSGKIDINGIQKNTNPTKDPVIHDSFIDNSEEENLHRKNLRGLFNDFTSNLRDNRSNKFEEEGENDTTIVGDTNIIKSVNPFIKIGCIILLPIIFIMSIPIIIVGGGISTKSVMEHVDCNITNSENCEQDESGSFINKFKNFFKYGSFGTNSEVIANKVSDIYEKIYNEYDFAIDMPLLISTLIVDLDSDDRGLNTEVNDEMLNRLEYIEDLALMQIVNGNNIYLCQSTEVNGKTKYYETLYYGDTTNIVVNSGSCNASNVGNYLSKTEAKYSEDEYFENLKNSVILNALYPNYEYDQDSIVSKIKMQYDLYKALYVGNDKEGNIPSYLMSDSNVNLTMPLKGHVTITSHFGNRTGEFAGFHNGIDVISNDTTIYAAGDGVVTRANHEATGGNVIEITHTDSSGKKYISQYAHIKNNGFLVNVGDTVNAGDPIAIMGSTGVASGVHLHFGFWDASTNRDYMDPRNLFNI